MAKIKAKNKAKSGKKTSRQYFKTPELVNKALLSHALSAKEPNSIKIHESYISC
jgi:hypothetical protein